MGVLVRVTGARCDGTGHCATVRELMDRAGYSTSAAAMRYQHAAEERGSIIAVGMNTALEGLSGGSTGTGLARTASGTTASQNDGPR